MQIYMRPSNVAQLTRFYSKEQKTLWGREEIICTCIYIVYFHVFHDNAFPINPFPNDKF